jgi:hypothetical protein
MNASDRAPWRDRTAIAAGVGAVAVAIWLAPASVDIVRWNADGPTRVALFAPLDHLGWIALVAALCLAAFFVWARGKPARLTKIASVARPLSLLWLWSVPYLPWLPDRIPLLLVLAGPIRWAIATYAVAAAAGIVARLDTLARDVAPRTGRRLVFAISLAVYLAAGTYSARTIGIGGDEPHYLMIAQSLITDGDLLIENNHQRKEYLPFFGGELRPDFMVRGKNGQIYSIHSPGLSVLLLPAFALTGYPGALVIVCLLAALTALAVFDLADAIAGRSAALFAWAATCLTVPFLPTAWLIYPEIAGALVSAWALRWIWNRSEPRTTTWLWRGVALAALPWLHTKFVVLLGVFGAALAWQLRGRLRALIALAAPVALSVAAWLWYFYLLYGVFDPQVPYGAYMPQVHARNIPRGLLGILFDQKFGVLVYSPIYLAAIGGWWAMVRRTDLRYLGLVLGAATALFMPSNARLYMWWGGSSSPARFFVPLIPCFAPMIAVALADARRGWTRALFGGWLLISVGIALTAAMMPDQLLLYSDPHGRARVLLAIEGGSPLAGSFPTFTPPDWRTSLVALLPWIAAGAAAIAALAMAQRLARRASPGGLGVVASIVFLVVAGLGTARPDAALRDETARRGLLELIWRWDPHGVRAFEYGRNAQVGDARLRELNVVALGAALEPVALPAGKYEARVWFAGAAARDGEILVGSARNAVFGRIVGAVANPATVPFELPSDAPHVAIKVRDDRLAARVVGAEIVPHEIVPVAARGGHTVRAVESITNAPRGYIVYLDSTTYPEGGVFWTRGTDPAHILVAPGGASRIALTMFLGPLSGDVRVSIAGKEARVRVEGNSPTEFEADLPRDARLVPVEIQSPGQFRPASVDPTSTDTRRLGCQVRIGLK